MAAALVASCELELSVMLADDGEMRRLNSEYRGIDETTDVLSFPQFSAEELDEIESCSGELLGDIVIGYEAATKQAAARGHSVDDELDLLAAHGLLHLLGYDHSDEAGALRMGEAERKLVGGSIIGEETGDYR